jgi:DnaD/phage-associated family protein
MKVSASVRLGRKRPPPLAIPGEVFTVYQPRIGALATLLWLNALWLAESGTEGDIELLLQQRLGLSFPQLMAAMDTLMEYELLEIAGDTGEYVVHEPLPATAAALKPVREGQRALSELAGAGAEAAVSSPAEEALPAEGRGPMALAKVVPPEVRPADPDGIQQSPDMEAVLQFYHKKIGMLGPTQFEKLRFWVEDQGMDGEVVAAAIEETVQCAHTPRINYLEGVLRNWHNDGIRTLKDLIDKNVSKVLSGASGPGGSASSGSQSPPSSMEGVPNAAAYQRVDWRLVDKWKELYPDEYDG